MIASFCSTGCTDFIDSFNYVFNGVEASICEPNGYIEMVHFLLPFSHFPLTDGYLYTRIKLYWCKIKGLHITIYEEVIVMLQCCVKIPEVGR